MLVWSDSVCIVYVVKTSKMLDLTSHGWIHNVWTSHGSNVSWSSNTPISNSGEQMRIEDDNIECPECLGNGYDLDGPMEDDEMEDCCVCGGTGTTTGEDWYPRGH